MFALLQLQLFVNALAIRLQSQLWSAVQKQIIIEQRPLVPSLDSFSFMLLVLNHFRTSPAKHTVTIKAL